MDPIREQLYEEHNMPPAGQLFVLYLLPVIEWAIKIESDIETETRDEVLAEIALWKAFDKEPKNKPFLLISGILLFYDYLYQMPFGIYGLSIVGSATLIGLVAGVRGRFLLAAGYAGARDEDGIPAELRLKALNVASTTVSLVYVFIGILIQMVGTSGLVGPELLNQNTMASGPLPPWVTLVGIFTVIYLWNFLRG